MGRESMTEYFKTVKRLQRIGIEDPTSQIIALAEEIKQYREKIEAMDKYIKSIKGPEPVTVMGYEAESLRLVAEMLKKHLIAPEDLQEVKRNVDFAVQVVYSEKANIEEELLKNFSAKREAQWNE